MESRVKELEDTIVEIEKERDFYFGKLRNVELLLQVKQDKGWEGCDLEGVVDSIFKVLYATADEDILVDEEGEVRLLVPFETSHRNCGLLVYAVHSHTFLC